MEFRPRFIPAFVLILSLTGLVACGDDNADAPADPITCTYDGASYEVGESVESGDCNSCSCDAAQDGGEPQVVCTAVDCSCLPEDCGPAPGMPNYLCDDGVTTAGPGECEIQEGGACGWTIVECPPKEYDACEDLACGELCDPCAPDLSLIHI